MSETDFKAINKAINVSEDDFKPIKNPQMQRDTNIMIEGKDKTNSEFDSLQVLWKVAVWMQTSGFYRPFIHFPAVLRKMFGTVMGHLMLKGKKRKIMTGINILFPKKSKKQRLKILSAYLSYMGRFMIDCMFCVPAVAQDHTMHKYISHEDIHYLDKALEKGKGVIMPTLHTGQFFHALGGIFIKPTTKDPSKKYDLVVLGGRDNAAMFAPITARYPNYYVLLTRQYSEVKDILIEHLQQNHIVVLYYDFASMKQLRLPLLGKPDTMLKASPQSIAALHRITGAPIVPVVTCPQGDIGKSRLKFLDPSAINEVSRTLTENKVPKKEFHRQLSYALNKEIHPYLFKYAHVWEELMAFGGYVYKNRLKFPANYSTEDFLGNVQEKMLGMVENSYEPNRDDKNLRRGIEKGFSQAIRELRVPKKPICENKTFIQYFDQDGKSERSKVLNAVASHLHKLGENTAAATISGLDERLR